MLVIRQKKRVSYKHSLNKVGDFKYIRQNIYKSNLDIIPICFAIFTASTREYAPNLLKISVIVYSIDL